LLSKTVTKLAKSSIPGGVRKMQHSYHNSTRRL